MKIIKIYKGVKQLLLCAVLAAGFFSVPACASLNQDTQAIAVERDMVWSAYDGQRREIFFSSQGKGGVWSEPVQLTNSNADNLLPCIVSTPDGKKYVVWTAMEDTQLSVMYAVFDGAAWTEPADIPGMPANTTMPFVAADDNGILWLVFVGNDGTGQDDVYSIRLQNGQWGKALAINSSNDVPDVNPFIEIAQTGAIQVTWEGFRNNDYTLLSSQWQGDRWSEEQPLPQGDKEKMQQDRKMMEKELLPEFVEDRSMLFIRINN